MAEMVCNACVILAVLLTDWIWRFKSWRDNF
jgi:hypothetical protein